MLSNIMYINLFSFFFFNDTPTTEIYTLSLHDALPICRRADGEPRLDHERGADAGVPGPASPGPDDRDGDPRARHRGDRKSTRLNSSHTVISYAVFCLKKKKKKKQKNTIYRGDT